MNTFYKLKNDDEDKTFSTHQTLSMSAALCSSPYISKSYARTMKKSGL